MPEEATSTLQGHALLHGRKAGYLLSKLMWRGGPRFSGPKGGRTMSWIDWAAKPSREGGPEAKIMP